MMENISFEQLAYELPEIWDEDFLSAEDHARVRELGMLVPKDTKTLLDVGCGNGLFLNHLKAEYPHRFSRLVGVDRSLTALEHVQTEKQPANVDRLPFGDLQFDTVTCMEVLEHLPVTIYDKAISEIARVAKESVIVCVPYKQDLRASLTECPSCFARFNADFHVRSYDEGTLQSLFAGNPLEPVETRLLGEQTLRYDQELRAGFWRLFQKKELPYWWPYAICPVCGFSDRKKLAEDLANRKQAKLKVAHQPEEPSALRRFLRANLPKRSVYRWIAVSYMRK